MSFLHLCLIFLFVLKRNLRKKKRIFGSLNVKRWLYLINCRSIFCSSHMVFFFVGLVLVAFFSFRFWYRSDTFAPQVKRRKKNKHNLIIIFLSVSQGGSLTHFFQFFAKKFVYFSRFRWFFLFKNYLCYS